MNGIFRFLFRNSLLQVESLLSYIILLSIFGILYEKWQCLYGVGVFGILAIVRVYKLRKMVQNKQVHL